MPDRDLIHHPPPHLNHQIIDNLAPLGYDAAERSRTSRIPSLFVQKLNEACT